MEVEAASWDAPVDPSGADLAGPAVAGLEAVIWDCFLSPQWHASTHLRPAKTSQVAQEAPQILIP